MAFADLFKNGKMLRLGSQGEIVREVQLGLKSLGYALKGTGYYGPATDVAVATFQKRAGLDDDGVFGDQTAAALDAALNRSPTNPAVQTAGVVAPVPREELSRPLWLEAGLKLVGIHEGVGAADNPIIMEWADDEGGDIAKTYTADSIPWCALLANHCLTKVGLKGTETLYALDFDADAMQKRLGRRWPAIRLPGPAVGAFAPMSRKGGGHIIIVVGRDQHGNVMGLGGNQSDKVSVIPFPLSRLNHGFWWPDSVKLPNASGMSVLPLVNSNGHVSTKES